MEAQGLTGLKRARLRERIAASNKPEAVKLAQIESVIFDIGNVLIRWDPCNLYRRMGFEDAQTRAIMDETGLLEINHRKIDAGAPYEATIAALAARFPQHGEFIRAFDTRWSEMLDGAIAQSVAALKDLKSSGMPVYGLSNFNREKFDIARSLFSFLDLFDELVVSGDVGMVKPDREIYALLIARCDLEPGTALFIDDSAANITTARQIGFDTVLFDKDETDLRAELARRNVTY